MRILIRCTAFLLLLAGSSLAQVTTATILGTVTDATGAVIPDVTVTAINIETNLTRTAPTNRVGEYSIGFLPVGAYRVEVTLQGFKKFIQSGVILEVNRNARVDPVLEVGTISES